MKVWWKEWPEIPAPTLLFYNLHGVWDVHLCAVPLWQSSIRGLATPLLAAEALEDSCRDWPGS